MFLLRNSLKREREIFTILIGLYLFDIREKYAGPQLPPFSALKQSNMLAYRH